MMQDGIAITPRNDSKKGEERMFLGLGLYVLLAGVTMWLLRTHFNTLRRDTIVWGVLFPIAYPMIAFYYLKYNLPALMQVANVWLDG